MGARVVVGHGDVRMNPVPVMAASMLVTGAVPVLRRVRVRGAGEPTEMLPKARVPGVIWSWDWAPVPVRGMVSGRVVASVLRLRVPVRGPVVVEVKVTVRVQVAAAARVELLAGQVLWMVEKSPVVVMLLKVIGEMVVLVICRGSWPLEGMLTVPKLRVVGLRVRGASDAVPRRVTNSREVDASDWISRVPVRVGLVLVGAGVSSALMGQVAPGVRVAQAVVAVKPVEARMLRMWRVVVPVLVRAMVWGGETAPMFVLGKVRELWESWKAARMEGLAGASERRGTTVPVKSMMVGLLAASDSRIRVPVSVRVVRLVEVVGIS